MSSKWFPVVTCVSLSLPNGRVSYNRGAINGRYPVDTVTSFSCNSGYSRSGSSSRICQTSGDWNQQTPKCNKNKKRNEHIFTGFFTENKKFGPIFTLAFKLLLLFFVSKWPSTYISKNITKQHRKLYQHQTCFSLSYLNRFEYH